MARPTKLTPELQERLLADIRIGLPYAKAAERAGITETSFYNWKERGQTEKSGIYFEFLKEVKKAVTDAMLRNVGLILQAGQGGKEFTETKRVYEIDDKGNQTVTQEIITKKEAAPQWQALAWLLERRHPSEWGRKDKLQLPVEEIDELISRGLDKLASLRKGAIPEQIGTPDKSGRGQD